MRHPGACRAPGASRGGRAPRWKKKVLLWCPAMPCPARPIGALPCMPACKSPRLASPPRHTKPPAHRAYVEYSYLIRPPASAPSFGHHTSVRGQGPPTSARPASTPWPPLTTNFSSFLLLVSFAEVASCCHRAELSSALLQFHRSRSFWPPARCEIESVRIGQSVMVETLPHTIPQIRNKMYLLLQGADRGKELINRAMYIPGAGVFTHAIRLVSFCTRRSPPGQSLYTPNRPGRALPTDCSQPFQ